MDVNFEYYKIFYYVAKYNNFTRAARVLGNSQPNVTRAMNCLEQQLHCTLLVRTNRGVFLTTEGEKLYTHVAAAMEQLFTAEEELAEFIEASRLPENPEPQIETLEETEPEDEEEIPF
jgi:DNA-binding transcriptional LysR family regulator